MENFSFYSKINPFSIDIYWLITIDISWTIFIKQSPIILIRFSMSVNKIYKKSLVILIMNILHNIKRFFLNIAKNFLVKNIKQ